MGLPVSVLAPSKPAPVLSWCPSSHAESSPASCGGAVGWLELVSLPPGPNCHSPGAVHGRQQNYTVLRFGPDFLAHTPLPYMSQQVRHSGAQKWVIPHDQCVSLAIHLLPLPLKSHVTLSVSPSDSGSLPVLPLCSSSCPQFPSYSLLCLCLLLLQPPIPSSLSFLPHFC